jgi:hypothetical protein
MNRTLALLLLVFTTICGYSQKIAVTDTGEQVILNDDGTWNYIDEPQGGTADIPVNGKQFTKDKSQTMLVKSTKANIGIWLNTAEWSYERASGEEAAEYNFQMKNEDLYGMLISEKMEIPIETLKIIAIENARAVAPDIKIQKEEFRNVNGTQVLTLQMSGTIEGIKFTYFGYYYSNSSGTIQLITYTGSSLFNQYSASIEKFLNGFVTL